MQHEVEENKPRYMTSGFESSGLDVGLRRLFGFQAGQDLQWNDYDYGTLLQCTYVNLSSKLKANLLRTHVLLGLVTVHKQTDEKLQSPLVWECAGPGLSNMSTGAPFKPNHFALTTAHSIHNQHFRYTSASHQLLRSIMSGTPAFRTHRLLSELMAPSRCYRHPAKFRYVPWQLTSGPAEPGLYHLRAVYEDCGL